MMRSIFAFAFLFCSVAVQADTDIESRLTKLENDMRRCSCASAVATPSDIEGRLAKLENDMRRCSCSSIAQPGNRELRPSTVGSFSQSGCSSNPTFENPNIFNLATSDNGFWPSGGVCRAYVTEVLTTSRYTISADFYVNRGVYGHSGDRVGIFYNAQDMNNFDFAFFRMNSYFGCYNTGKMEDESVGGEQSGICSSGQPAVAQWFNVKVEVDGRTAKLYKDYVLIRTVTTNFDARGSGGVMLGRADSTSIKFKNFLITSN